MDSSSSVADMAANKFKQMLNKELLGLSEGSHSDNQIADFITSTYYGSYFKVLESILDTILMMQIALLIILRLN